MTDIAHFQAHTSVTHLIAAIEEFDGACHPDFDCQLEDLERQFAELRMSVVSE